MGKKWVLNIWGYYVISGIWMLWLSLHMFKKLEADLFQSVWYSVADILSKDEYFVDGQKKASDSLDGNGSAHRWY